MSRFVRKVRTGSGAVAVQVVTRQGRQVVGIEHVGSAHADEELALLVAVAKARLLPEGQAALDLGEMVVAPERMDDVADWTLPADLRADLSAVRPALGLPSAAGSARVSGSVDARVLATSSVVLWQVLVGGYARLGFDVLGDEAFRAMVLARIVEPTSKADTVRVSAELGAPCPTVRTLFRSLKRCQDKDYRGKLAKACTGRSAAAGGLNALVMYDCTTLHFEISDEDPGPSGLRRVGMSKEHRVDPQVQVGLLVDRGGFPLEIGCFEGNTAECDARSHAVSGSRGWRARW